MYKSVGSDEFLTSRTELLNRYRESKSKSSHAPVKTRHGVTAEAVFREWLGTFLPKKFGVTKGYIVVPSVGLGYELREHDVIIYDRDNATILWENSGDCSSPADSSRGISAENVLAVLEIKATLTKRNVTSALEKLHEVNQFVSVDKVSGEIVSELNPKFHCCTVFFELLKSDRDRAPILEELVLKSDIFNYTGGIVLSAQGDTMDCSGKVEFFSDKTPLKYHKSPLFRNLDSLPFSAQPEKSSISIPSQGSLLLQVMPYDEPANPVRCESSENSQDTGYRWYYEKSYSVHSKGIMVGESQYLAASVTWAKSNFARFAFELKARLEGTYVTGKVVSNHGLFFDGVL